jgi:hypothetical protein
MKELEMAMTREMAQIALIQEHCTIENKVFGWDKKIFNCFFKSSTEDLELAF